MKYDLDVVTLLSHLEDLSTFYQAIVGAGTVHILNKPHEITVFAPENEPFAELQGGTTINALEDLDKARAIVTYHVVPQKLMASDLRKQKSVTTLEGGMLTIEEHHWLRHGIKINDAVVKEADIEGTNGVIHVIDSVLMP